MSFETSCLQNHCNNFCAVHQAAHCNLCKPARSRASLSQCSLRCLRLQSLKSAPSCLVLPLERPLTLRSNPRPNRLMLPPARSASLTRLTSRPICLTAHPIKSQRTDLHAKAASLHHRTSPSPSPSPSPTVATRQASTPASTRATLATHAASMTKSLNPTKCLSRRYS